MDMVTDRGVFRGGYGVFRPQWVLSHPWKDKKNLSPPPGQIPEYAPGYR